MLEGTTNDDDERRGGGGGGGRGERVGFDALARWRVVNENREEENGEG